MEAKSIYYFTFIRISISIKKYIQNSWCNKCYFNPKFLKFDFKILKFLRMNGMVGPGVQEKVISPLFKCPVQ
jgi:hypothetical protein